VGPAAAATAPIPPQAPVARPCCRWGKAPRRIDSETGISAAAPTDCPTRKAMSQPIEGDSPQASEKPVNTTRPNRKTRF